MILEKTPFIWEGKGMSVKLNHMQLDCIGVLKNLKNHFRWKFVVVLGRSTLEKGVRLIVLS